MTADAEDSCLGWHEAYLFDFARYRAAIAFLELHGRPITDLPTVSERAGRDLVADVAEPMVAIHEDAALIRRAQLAALETFERHLRELVLTSPQGGHA